jgi:hypothetical protein
MTPEEIFDRATYEHRYCRNSIRVSIVCIVLLALLYVGACVVKGWDNAYLIGLIGFAILALTAAQRRNEMRNWNQMLIDLRTEYPHLGEKHDH